ncbi:hypothetical protein AX16_006965 [Volvariella volvacea WC 439]|nr:hypothetical protein AX16_006965 [Volvariella volvacea WC 439]
MPANNLQGLNIVHPVPPHGDAQDLLSGPPFPDLSAQLDLWTNLSFDSEESPITRPEEGFKKGERADEEEEDETRSHPTPVTGETAIHDGHTNVVTGTVVPNTQPPQLNSLPNLHPPPLNLNTSQLFDINALFSNFGTDPFAAAFANPHPALTPSLAQLLALHSMQNAYAAPLHHPVQAALPQHIPSQSAPVSTISATTARKPSSIVRSSTEDVNTPATKRARTRKSSISASASPEGAMPSPSETPSASTNAGATLQALSAAEDKRKRNTAASARFRLKKKEREAALEGKAKELEIRVNELERECEALRRENGWLKGLVVGVTGAAQGPVAAAAAASTQVVAPPTTISTATKRAREEVDAA